MTRKKLVPKMQPAHLSEHHNEKNKARERCRANVDNGNSADLWKGEERNQKKERQMRWRWWFTFYSTLYCVPYLLSTSDMFFYAMKDHVWVP